MGPGPEFFVFFPFFPERSYITARDLREAQLVGGVVVARKVLWAPVPSFLRKYYGPRSRVFFPFIPARKKAHRSYFTSGFEMGLFLKKVVH
jgi:hypothetical protein